jgi:hypothetical protein
MGPPQRRYTAAAVGKPCSGIRPRPFSLRSWNGRKENAR